MARLQPQPAQRPGYLSSAGQALLFFSVYYAAAELGHLLSFSQTFPTIWPPSGILLAGLLIFRYRQWPTVLAVAFSANCLSDLVGHQYTFSWSLSHWLITASEAAVGAWLLRRFVSARFSGETLREIMGLSVGAAILTTMVGATIGETVLYDSLVARHNIITWGLLWNSHMLGTIVFAPPALTLALRWGQWSKFRIPLGNALETAAAFTCLIVFAMLVYSHDTHPYSFLVFPVLIWIALRFNMWGSWLCNFVRVAVAIWSTRAGYGPFAGDYPVAEQAVILDSFLSITCTTSLFLAAVISERRHANRDLKQSEVRYRDLVENIGELVQSVDASGKILYTNSAWRQTLGYSSSEIESLSIFQVIHADDLPLYRLQLIRLLAGENSSREQLRFLTKDGRVLVVEGTSNCRVVEGQPNVTRSIYRDITVRRANEVELDSYRRQLEAANQQLQLLAATDGLTGLSNRRAFHQRLGSEVERTERHSQEMSLIILDIDHFKKINDQYGHAAGDVVLQSIARLLAEHSRTYDCVARIGGEEFAVILPKTSEPEAVTIANRMRHHIASTEIAGRLITASLGIATLAPSKEPSLAADVVSTLFKSADAALYYSKEHGRNKVTHSRQMKPATKPARVTEADSALHRFELANR